MVRLGGRTRRPGEPCAGGSGDARQPAGRRRHHEQQQQIGTGVMAWWRARVVAPVRRAWLAIAAARARVRKGECGILSLHQDVQTCGYQDVQVMWNMLSSEKEAAAAAAEGAVLEAAALARPVAPRRRRAVRRQQHRTDCYYQSLVSDSMSE